MDYVTINSIFRVLSKIIVIIPIGIILIALFMQLSRKSFTLSSRQISITPKAASLPVPSVTVNASSTIQSILSGPLICMFSSKDATVSAYIKSQKVQATLEQKKSTVDIILVDDCIHIWERQKTSGTKICGLGSYLTIFGQMKIGNLISLGIPFSIPSLMPAHKIDIQTVLQSCKKEDFNGNGYFNLPKNVVFTERKLF